MNTLKQLLRQPMKTVFGTILVGLAVAVLGVCLGQSMAARETKADLEYQFTTIALPTSNYNFKFVQSLGVMGVRSTMNEEVAAWVDEVIKNHPELVETVSYPGLASAYIPELTGVQYQTNDYKSYYGVNSAGRAAGSEDKMLPQTDKAGYLGSFDSAMLVVTLDEIGEVEPLYLNVILNDVNPETGHKETVKRLRTYEVTLKGTIQQVVHLSSELPDPTGWPIELDLTLSGLESVEDLQLEVGQQYIVYGLDYYTHTNRLQEGLQVRDENEKAHILTKEQQRQWQKLYPGKEVPLVVYGDLEGWLCEGDEAVQSRGRLYTMDNNEAKQYFSASMSLCNFVSVPHFTYIDGSVAQNVSWTTANGEKVTISWDEYKKMISIPTIAKLDGTVEEFLAGNKFWADNLEYSQINMHAFPVVGVEKLDYITDFNRGLARVTQGREFTREEMESGAKVCIISETLAQLNGLRVGDTINPQFYDPGRGVQYQSYVSLGQGTVNPNAYFFTSQAEMYETEEYTIIGLYRQENEWEDIFVNCYTFTPNTIFVPHQAVSVSMDYGSQGMFKTIVLRNGSIETFDAIVMDKKFETIRVEEDAAEMFVYNDQGYSRVMGNFLNYEELAQQVLIVGVVVYGIVLILFLLLYPGRQGKTLRTMANFGTPRKDKIAHVLVSSLGILLPGTILGAVLGLALWGVVVGRLLTVSGAMFSLTLDLGTLALIALAQLLLALALTLLLAIPMTKHENLMKRK